LGHRQWQSKGTPAYDAKSHAPQIDPDKATLEKAMQGHVLEQALLMGVYSRR
jgi:phosphatidylethanolamine-binding protein (PEBP) family uncharacterized protein